MCEAVRRTEMRMVDCSLLVIYTGMCSDKIYNRVYDMLALPCQAESTLATRDYGAEGDGPDTGVIHRLEEITHGALVGPMCSVKARENINRDIVGI